MSKCIKCHVSAAEAQILPSGVCRDCEKQMNTPILQNENVENAYKAELARMKPLLEIKQQQLEEKQKHEEIKRMAWEYCNTNYENIKRMHIDNNRTSSPLRYCLEVSWQVAEMFYNFAKQKEQENEIN